MHQPTDDAVRRSTGIQDDLGQPIWTQAVIPAEPDAWIWAGDMAYLDNPVRRRTRQER